MRVSTRPALRAGVGAAVDRDGHLRILTFARSRQLVYAVDPAVLDLVALLDGTRSPDQLLQEVRRRHPDLSPTDIRDVLETLDAEGVLDHVPSQADHALLDSAEQDIYRRQLEFLREFAQDARQPLAWQKRLRAARVLVLGVGGTGSWVAQSLALAGVGRLRLVDPDVVEPSNLSRQVLYGVDDVGRPKADAAACALELRLRGLVAVEPVQHQVRGPQCVDDLLSGCDLAINCADVPDINTTSAWMSQACHPRGLPHVVGGGYDGHVGLIGPTVVPGRTACWSCYQRHHERLFPSEQLTYLTPTRRRHTGALAALAAVVTNLQVWDVVRVLTGCGEPLLADRLGELDLVDLSITWTAVARDPDCPTCSTERTA